MFLRFIYLFLERGEGREKEREKNVHVQLVASHTPPTGDLARNPDMCPEWELNLLPFGSQASTQSTEPHQPGHNIGNHFNSKFQKVALGLGVEWGTLPSLLRLSNWPPKQIPPGY